MKKLYKAFRNLVGDTNPTVLVSMKGEITRTEIMSINTVGKDKLDIQLLNTSNQEKIVISISK